MFKKNKSKTLKIIIIVLVLAAIIIAFLFLRGRGKNSAKEIKFQETPVAARDIQKSISGSGSLQPANSYSVSVRYSGEIISDSIEEGDKVSKDQQLYIVNSSDSNDLIVSSAYKGYISRLMVDVGDSVRQGQEIATVVDNSVLKITLHFSNLDAKQLSAGQQIDIILDSTFEKLVGTIKSVSDLAETGEDNVQKKTVVIELNNPGSLDVNQYATASVNGIKSIDNAQFEYIGKHTITSDASGVVEKINCLEGSKVSAGSTIILLAQDDAQSHKIVSPINGTIVDKAYKRGENVESGTTLCTIYDLSYLEMLINVDELDIANVNVGQKVAVTADATGITKYEGYVSKVSIAGSVNGGSATYPVTIRIDNYGDLLPSMSADAVIVIEEAHQALAVPNAAVIRGNRVLLTPNSPSAQAALQAGAMAEESGNVYVEVEIGISDDDFTQIISGLTEEDTVVYFRTENSSMQMNFRGMNMPGGMNRMPTGRPNGNRGGF